MKSLSKSLFQILVKFESVSQRQKNQNEIINSQRLGGRSRRRRKKKTRASLDQVATSSHLVKTGGTEENEGTAELEH
jgi:hypothetical protein